MATYAVHHQVMPRSVDSAGVSVSTATADTTDPRRGQLYNPTTLAAAVPVWFHPLPDGSYLGLFSRRLHTATVDTTAIGGPVRYSTSTETTTPSWAVFDPSTGALDRVADIPTRVIGNRTLTAAVSRTSYLFVLSQIGDTALLQHFRVGTRSEALLLQGEEILPGGLSLGLHTDTNDVWVFGALNGKLTVARKNWGRIGLDAPWLYHTDDGWSEDFAALTALPGNLPAEGPVSVAHYRDRLYVTAPVRTPAAAATNTTPAVPSSWSAKTWSSRAIDNAWSAHPFTVPLGDDATYCGGTAQLQPQLALTPGYTSVATTRGETVLTADSSYSQVFTGEAAQTVVLPPAVAPIAGATVSYPAYTVHNRSLSELQVFTAGQQKVGTVTAHSSASFTPSSPTPTLAVNWTQASAARTQDHRIGFPYVATVKLGTGSRTLLTSWGAFEV